MANAHGRPVAIVFGGAGGIGSAICRKLAESGIQVVVGYNTATGNAEVLAKSLPGYGHSARHAPVTDTAALAKLAEGIAADYGRCDAIVNCAGTTRFVKHSDLASLGDELIDKILATNVRGAFATVRAFQSLLEKSTLKGGGVVVNLSSAAGNIAIGSNVMYCASKAALDNMTKSLGRALAPRIRVVSVAPALVDTEFVKSLDQAWRDAQAASTPMGRLATPEEIAAAVAAAITTLTFTTGSILQVDGGRTLGV
ncbi:MAG TPA: SDR family oxidoreductase [Bryobacteraceae bacterium]|nr:SDR family oxidoreductase [Bryobacteraceae bacterium]